MKTIKVFMLTILAFIFVTGCDDKEHYVDLKTGKSITVEKDTTTGYMINTETKEPVDIYVNTTTHDTIYGRTGKVINNLVVRHEDGSYTYEADGGMKVTDNDYKKKVQDDGDVKIKDEDSKVKIEKDGETKVKDK